MYKQNSRGWLKHIDFVLWDVAALQIAFILAYVIRNGGGLPFFIETYRVLAIIYIAVDILIAAMLNTMHNVMKRGYYQEFVQTLKQVLLVLLIMILVMFSFKTSGTFSRGIIYMTAAFHFVLGYLIRIWWKKVIRKLGKSKSKATMILVAHEKQVPDILAHLKSMDDVLYSGLVLSNRDAEGEVITGLRVVANLSNAADYICREWVDEVFIYPAHLTEMETSKSDLFENVDGFINDAYNAFVKKDYSEGGNKEHSEEERKASVSLLIEQCRQMSVPVHIRLPMTNIGGKSFIEKVGGYNVLTTTSNYASRLQLAMKRAMDIVGGLFGSLIALIVMAVYGPKIKKESPGPILFKQTRIGQNGKKFEIYKIRSMYMDAEERKKELMSQNRVSDGMMFKMEFDPRVIGNKIVDGKPVTGIGEKIRSGSWDEWPQFFNVLRGQMSLVGTRPPTVDEWEKYKYHHRARLATKPGITGMWQVSGRSSITDFEDVVKLDTEYIENWSIGLDIRILLKTVKAVRKKDGAM